MNKTLIIGFLLLCLVIGGAIYFNSQPRQQPTAELKSQEEEDSKAYFAIFTNGTLRDFSAARYHNLSEDVFISSENPMVVNIKAAGITWDDFFKTLPMKLTKDCLTTGTGQIFCTNGDGTLKFYLNGKESQNFLATAIKNGDKALITYGDESDSEIQEQLSLLE